MLVEVSTGEALDKYSILEIKHQRITNEYKRNAVQAEIDKLSEVRNSIDRYPFLYSVLLETNRTIWDLTDTMKGLHHTDSRYASVSHQIFDENQKRFRIKNMLNYFTSSDLKEQKSYAESEVTIYVTDMKTAIPVIWDLSFQYDIVNISGKYTTILIDMFPTPNFKFIPNKNIVLDSAYSVPALEKHNPQPIRYATGGRLGDFIHQLSVVYEKFLETGRPGILYVGEQNVGGDTFERGVQATINDISPILKTLPYIHSIEEYTGQKHEVNLSWWRFRTNLYGIPWKTIFGETYNVKWGSHAWLTSDIRPDLADVTLISTTPRRWVKTIRWDKFIPTLSGRVMFLRIVDSDYDDFCERSGTKLPCVDARTFTELVTAIHSCRTFVGTLSMPLAVADALKKDSIALVMPGDSDEARYIRDGARYICRF